MKCKFCGREITKTQLEHAQAIKDYHTDCLDDQSREQDDAYYRDEDGRRVSQRQ